MVSNKQGNKSGQGNTRQQGESNRPNEIALRDRTRDETKKEKVILDISKDEELKKCRFVCVDQNYRLFECSIHQDKEGNYSHGLRLFPPHQWVVENGVPYKILDNQKIVWYKVNNAKKKTD